MEQTAIKKFRFGIQNSGVRSQYKKTAVKFQDMITRKISKSLKAYLSSIPNSDY